MNFIKGLFISKRKLLERINSLEDYVGADYTGVKNLDYTYFTHQPIRDSWNKNPIAALIIKEESKK